MHSLITLKCTELLYKTLGSVWSSIVKKYAHIISVLVLRFMKKKEITINTMNIHNEIVQFEQTFTSPSDIGNSNKNGVKY